MAASSGVKLLTNAAATGPIVQWDGGQGVFVACGTFGGATLTLNFRGPDGVTWIAAGAATTLTANGAGTFVLPACELQVVITAGPPSAMYASAARVIA